MSTDNLFVALLHHPVYNKQGKVVTTSVANMDVHDVSRAARTYGVKRFYIVTPVAAQQNLVKLIQDHWQRGFGASYNPSRKEAFSIMHIKSSLEEVREDIRILAGREAALVATGASLRGDLVTFAELREKLRDGAPYLIVLGTGWGIAEEIVAAADLRLEPVEGAGDYNHLSVRSAAAVILDRLRGMRYQSTIANDQ